MCVYFICMLLMIVIVGNFDSSAAGLAESAFDLCFDGMVAGATLYFWSLLALPVLYILARTESAWKQRGAR
ncbi:hypothetical protein D7192_36880 [Burkholderia cepacia]|nr:hypothetical protein WK35_19890 [Burkholderia vietnamiensis]MBB0074055.1 hypothetical protein [Burkholderia cepacia]ONS58959.1 hypothetical protein A8E33_21520 [Burkholderia cenocepacia]ONS80234.1 hypothetical protein A8E34_19890 [Burkholderia cenocepacia]ONS89387.1 hypothetical protein A8E35_04505 [Burkholderia cenocepacia]